MLFIIDLEATCWESKEIKLKKKSEIIELGGAILKTQTSSIYTFSEFVKPVLNPILSEYCINLTSIKQKDVENASCFSISLDNFLKKATNYLENKKIKNVVFGSWGMYDKKQLIEDCKLHNIKYPFGRHWNIKQGFSQMLNTKRGYGLSRALKKMELQFEGQQHRGEDDAKNIARLVISAFGPTWKNYINK